MHKYNLPKEWFLKRLLNSRAIVVCTHNQTQQTNTVERKNKNETENVATKKIPINFIRMWFTTRAMAIWSTWNKSMCSEINQFESNRIEYWCFFFCYCNIRWFNSFLRSHKLNWFGKQTCNSSKNDECGACMRCVNGAIDCKQSL